MTANELSLIIVDPTNALPNRGVVLIDNEQIRYRGKIGDTLVQLDRGFNGTVATAHDRGSAIVLLILPTRTPTEGRFGQDISSTAQGSGCSVGGPRNGGSWILLLGGVVAGLARFRRRSH